MADLKSATPKTPETDMKLYATDKKLNFVPQCNLRRHTLPKYIHDVSAMCDRKFQITNL